jgi:NADPH:quinone reductase
MKAIILDGPGKPETMKLAERPKPEPGPGEIRIAVRAAGLNPVDYKLAANGIPTWTYPFIPGVDGAGIVDELGEGVTDWVKGDRVVYHGDMTKPGTFAEYAVTTAQTAAKIPDGLSFVEAAAFPCAGLTAYLALVRKMRVGQGQSILVHAGAGGVGGYAIQLAKALGASRILTTASPNNFEFIRSLGADETIDYNTEDVIERVTALTDGIGVDFILNTVNRATAQADLTALAYNGQLSCIAGAPVTVADFQPSNKTFSVHKLLLGGAHASNDRRAKKDLAVMADEFMALMTAGKVEAMVTETVKLDGIPQALARLAERHVRGKIVAEL